MASYPNGDVPVTAMVPVQNFAPIEAHATVKNGSNLILIVAAYQLILLQAAFALRFKKPLNVSEAYRSLANQVVMKILQAAGGALAATPGTSIHGWALAVDFGSGVASYGSAEKIWMDANAPLYGWHPTGNGFSRREAWHYEFQPGTATITTTALSTTVLHPAPVTHQTQNGDDMFATQIVTASKGSYLPVGAKFILDVRAKTVTRIDTAAKLTAAQKLTLRGEWNTILTAQSSNKPISWTAADAESYKAGGYTTNNTW